MTIDQVKSGSDFKSFISLPWYLYNNDKCWIPPLRIELKQRARRGLSKRDNIVLFLARQGKDVLGRISASISGKTSGEGNFGFYEAVNDINVSRMLVDRALEWLKEKGARKVVGPYSFLLFCGFSFFCKQFYVVWMKDGKVVEKRLVKPFSMFVKPRQDFVKLIEIPVGSRKI